MTTISLPGCVASSPKVTVEIPERPQLVDCPPDFPEIHPKHVEMASVGNTDIVGDAVVMSEQDADKLADWVMAFAECNEENEVIMAAYALKLENRLKAFGGK